MKLFEPRRDFAFVFQSNPIALDTALSLTSYVLSSVLSERERRSDSDRTTAERGEKC